MMAFPVLEIILISIVCNIFKEQARLQKNLTVKELMFLSGFTSRSSFYRYFASVEKMSPSEYMEMLNREN